MNQFILFGITCASILVLYAFTFQIGRRPKGLPPGPPTLPIIGNLHLIPKERPHVQFQKWAEEYGPIYSLIMGSKIFIVLSTPTAVKDLLDKKSSIYSSRPDIYLGHEIVGHNQRFVTMKYGPMWRSVHKMMHNTLNISTAVAYIPFQDVENKDMMLAFLDEPEDFLKHNHLKERSSIIELFQNFEQWGKLVGAASAQVLDLYPVLRKLPTFLLPAYKHAMAVADSEMELYMLNWNATKRNILNGTCHPCASYDVLKAQKSDSFSDQQAAYIAGSLLEGGSDTTSGTLVGFVFAMMMFPEVQKKAQEQLDEVSGLEHRLPTLDDVMDLPYIRGCVKETIRWMPTMILGAPHSNIEEDFYEGYRIPNGSTILANNWTLNMDPTRNPKPRDFDPMRFKGDMQTEHQSATNKDENTRQNWIFGSGPRQCQGMHIAERSLILAAARMLWAFNFERPLENGKPIPVDIDDLVGTLTVQPRDFKVNVIPRTKAKAELLRKAWKECEATLLDPTTKQWVEVPSGMKFSNLNPEKF